MSILLFPDSSWWHILPDGSLHTSVLYSDNKALNYLYSSPGDYTTKRIPAEWDDGDIENFAVDYALAKQKELLNELATQ